MAPLTLTHSPNFKEEQLLKMQADLFLQDEIVDLPVVGKFYFATGHLIPNENGSKTGDVEIEIYNYERSYHSRREKER